MQGAGCRMQDAGSDAAACTQQLCVSRAQAVQQPTCQVANLSPTSNQPFAGHSAHQGAALAGPGAGDERLAAAARRRRRRLGRRRSPLRLIGRHPQAASVLLAGPGAGRGSAISLASDRREVSSRARGPRRHADLVQPQHRQHDELCNGPPGAGLPLVRSGHSGFGRSSRLSGPVRAQMRPDRAHKLQRWRRWGPIASLTAPPPLEGRPAGGRPDSLHHRLRCRGPHRASC